MKGFISRKLFRVLLATIVFGFLITINPYNFFSPIRSVISASLLPFNKFAYVISLKTEYVKDFLFSIGELKKENENLLKENQNLIAENAELRDQRGENEFLRQQLQLLPRDRFALESASVISIDSTGSGAWIDIDKGSADGIREGMAVIVSKSILVGKVQQVFLKSSKVMLLSNPKSALNVLANDTGAKGIVRGEYGLGIIMDMVMQNDTINKGSEVVTSGIGSALPRGLYVGVIREVRPSEDHLFQQAFIDSPIDSSKLQTVFIIKEDK